MVKRMVTGIVIALTMLGISAVSARAQAGLSLEFDGAMHVFIPLMDGARTGFTRFASVDAVSVEGVDGSARLVLELALPPGARTGDSPHDARVSFRPEGWRDYWVSSPDLPEGAVVIDHLDLSGPIPRIVGRFALPLCFTPTPVHMPDPARCLPASGRFDTQLVQD